MPNRTVLSRKEVSRCPLSTRKMLASDHVAPYLTAQTNERGKNDKQGSAMVLAVTSCVLLWISALSPSRAFTPTPNVRRSRKSIKPSSHLVLLEITKTSPQITSISSSLRVFADHEFDETTENDGVKLETPSDDNIFLQQRSNRAPLRDGRGTEIGRRDALLLTAALTSIPAAAAFGLESKSGKTLEDLDLGEGKWMRSAESTVPTDRESSSSAAAAGVVTPSFATYTSRFLIQYDDGVSNWWGENIRQNSLLPADQSRNNLGRSFGSLAMSVQLSLIKFIGATPNSMISPLQVKSKFSELAKLFLDKYGQDEESRRQIGLLFATLPPDYQPNVLKTLSTKTIAASGQQGTIEHGKEKDSFEQPSKNSNLPLSFTEEVTSLLPSGYECARISGTQSYTIIPPLNLYEIGVDDEFGQSATATAFGPLSSTPLKRERPDLSFDVYALLGISGAAGCALTHSVVIPLDVVKTRLQTDPDQYDGIVDGAVTIARDEGIDALLLGAQATIAGYLWYGLSVYPCYAFFNRYISQSLLSPQVAAVHGNDVALFAGALASVVASLGLTPMEACRIRTVAEPERYKSIGLLGTLGVISEEDPALGWKSLYAGLPSLLTRQVIFGSVKFLAFEKACEAIFAALPELRDATWTSLGVSLVAGGIAGALSSVVSQPADSVLTYVAQQSGGGGEGSLGVIEGSRIMIEKEGPGSLFRGLGSRCIWAGSIIAGQFFLYDIFRTYFGVSGYDLSQVFEIFITEA